MLDLLYIPTGFALIGLARTSIRAFRAGNPVLGGNALVSTVAIAVPLAVDLLAEPIAGAGVHIGPVLPLWLAVAGTLHTVGMTTVYERVWWWDHLTHTVSAGLVAAVAYGLLHGIDADPVTADLDGATIAALTVGVTLLAGVLWELVELAGRDVASALDAEPMLVPYGRRDTLIDLLVDAVGAVLIVAIDLRVFVPLAEQSPSTAEAAMRSWVALMVVGVVLVTAVVAWHHAPRSR